ncbi:DUF5812 family protein [Halorarius halobius]|uniref:DUF5812 family protein n=1 Tax=Halorarius halobius TaxID=2962671 RepID=UPI0020CF2174|nr:DUF5812 family protein [Halorarius halobius]
MSDQTEGRFVVTHAEDESAVLKDVDGGQVHTLAENPGVGAGDVLDATLSPEPPMEVTWRVVEVEARRSIDVAASAEPPTEQERAIAADQSVGELTRKERAGMGELHVLTVPEDDTDEAVDDVLDDEGTLARAARMDDVNRVEVRSEPGVVSVRYLP